MDDRFLDACSPASLTECRYGRHWHRTGQNACIGLVACAFCDDIARATCHLTFAPLHSKSIP
eukprot:12079083-Alexandrium_andersonii.AAC.1